MKVACIDTALYDLIIGNNILRPTDCDDSGVQNGGETNTAQTQETDECKQWLTDTIIFQRTHSVGHEELGNQVDHENEQKRLETTQNVDTQEVAETSEDCIRSEVREKDRSVEESGILINKKEVTRSTNDKQDAADGKRFSTENKFSEEYVKDMGCKNNQQRGYESEVAAVQTRKQKLIEERALKPLKISKDEALNITTEQFKKCREMIRS